MATIDKIRVSGVTYDIVDGSAVHSLDGYWTSGQTNDAITAATGALAETIAEQDYASKAYVQSAITEAGGTTTATVQTMIDESISGKADSSAVTEEISSAVSAATSGAVYNFSVIKQNGGNKLFYYLTKGTGDYPSQTIFEAGSGLTLDNNLVLKVDTSVIASKNDIPSVSGYADAVAYDSNSKEMKFYHGGTGGSEVFSFDASPFLIDGMVQNVEIKDVTISGESVTCLVISFNTDAGKQDINIPISSIFDASNYYTTAQTDSKIAEATSGKADSSAVTEEISAAVSGKVNVSDNQVEAYGVVSTTATTSDGSYSADSYTNGAFYAIAGSSDDYSKPTSSYDVTVIDSSGNVVFTESGSSKSYSLDNEYLTISITSHDYDGYYTGDVTLTAKGSYRFSNVEVSIGGMYQGGKEIRYYTSSTKYPSYQSAEAIENNIYPKLDSIDTALNDKQNTLTPGDGIQISGNVISVTGAPLTIDNTVTSGSSNPVKSSGIYDFVTGETATKQDTLVSGTNIKTVNNESVLGSGNIATLQAEVSGTTLIFS